MTIERDELAELLHDNITDALPSLPYRSEIGEQVDMAVQHVLAAGYRKPRQVTTVEELDALPNASIILEVDGSPTKCVKRADGKNWWVSRPNAMASSNLIPLPATVLHVGDAK